MGVRLIDCNIYRRSHLLRASARQYLAEKAKHHSTLTEELAVDATSVALYDGQLDPLRSAFRIADSNFFSSKGLSKLATGFALRIICRV